MDPDRPTSKLIPLFSEKGIELKKKNMHSALNRSNRIK